MRQRINKKGEYKEDEKINKKLRGIKIIIKFNKFIFKSVYYIPLTLYIINIFRQKNKIINRILCLTIKFFFLDEENF
jgi:hypothetical protein